MTKKKPLTLPNVVNRRWVESGVGWIRARTVLGEEDVGPERTVIQDGLERNRDECECPRERTSSSMLT